jgi:hypothetical protein
VVACGVGVFASRSEPEYAKAEFRHLQRTFKGWKCAAVD